MWTRRFPIFLGLFAAGFVFAAGAAAEGPAAGFIRNYLRPFLANRTDYYQVQVVTEGTAERPAHIRLVSRLNGKILGRYDIYLRPDLTTLPSRSPRVDLQWIRPAPRLSSGGTSVPSAPYVGLKGRLDLPLQLQEDPTDLLRSLVRADAFLSPMQTPPDGKFALDPAQQNIIDQLEEIRKKADARNEAMRALMFLPPGSGKTVITGQYLKHLRDLNATPFIILYVVENTEILDEATIKIRRHLDLSPAQIKKVYGDEADQQMFTGRAQLISTTRTTLHANLDNLTRFLREYKGRVVVVLDEAHHTGKLNGQFNDIIQALRLYEKPGDVRLGLDATPWHRELDVIKEFDDNVVTTLSPEARRPFLEQRRLIQMARFLLFRAMAQGYLCPIHSYRHVKYLENEGAERILSQRYLSDWTERFADKSESERYDALKADLNVHMPLIRQMLKEILATVRRDERGNVLIHNRGIVYVPSIAHASVYAFILNRLGAAHGVQAMAYHSGLRRDRRDQVMDWFTDQQRTRSRDGRYDHQQLSRPKKHKYVFTIRALGEGVDMPQANHIILAKPYSDDDLTGMQELIQNIGRGSRLSDRKPDFAISDFTGDMERLIFEDMDQSLLDRLFVEGAEIQLGDAQALVPGRSAPARRPVEVRLDNTTLDPARFVTDTVTIPDNVAVVPPPATSGIAASAPAAEPTDQTLRLRPKDVLPEFARPKKQEDREKSGPNEPGPVDPQVAQAVATLGSESPWLQRMTWRQWLGMPGALRQIWSEYRYYHGWHSPVLDIEGSLAAATRVHLSSEVAETLVGAAQGAHNQLFAILKHNWIVRDDLEEADRSGLEDENFALSPLLRAHLDEPTPWTWAHFVFGYLYGAMGSSIHLQGKQIAAARQMNPALPEPQGKVAESLNIIGSHARGPSVFEATSALARRGAGSVPETHLEGLSSWGEVIHSPAFLNLLLRRHTDQAQLIRSFSNTRVSLSQALRMRRSGAIRTRYGFGSESLINMENQIREAGFTIDLLPRISNLTSPFRPVHLLTLPETLVWRRTFDFGTPDIDRSTAPFSIIERLIRLRPFPHHFRDFVERINVALGLNLGPDLDVDQIERVLRTHPQPAFTAPRANDISSWLEPMTWREVLNYPTTFELFLDEIGDRLRADVRDKGFTISDWLVRDESVVRLLAQNLQLPPHRVRTARELLAHYGWDWLASEDGRATVDQPSPYSRADLEADQIHSRLARMQTQVARTDSGQNHTNDVSSDNHVLPDDPALLEQLQTAVRNRQLPSFSESLSQVTNRRTYSPPYSGSYARAFHPLTLAELNSAPVAADVFLLSWHNTRVPARYTRREFNLLELEQSFREEGKGETATAVYTVRSYLEIYRANAGNEIALSTVYPIHALLLPKGSVYARGMTVFQRNAEGLFVGDSNSILQEMENLANAPDEQALFVDRVNRAFHLQLPRRLSKELIDRIRDFLRTHPVPDVKAPSGLVQRLPVAPAESLSLAEILTTSRGFRVFERRMGGMLESLDTLRFTLAGYTLLDYILHPEEACSRISPGKCQKLDDGLMLIGGHHTFEDLRARFQTYPVVARAVKAAESNGRLAPVRITARELMEADPSLQRKGFTADLALWSELFSREIDCPDMLGGVDAGASRGSTRH
ncbi:MAG: DEAD/DEAH box helicase family protein [Bdellovibrionales bacterium]